MSGKINGEGFFQIEGATESSLTKTDKAMQMVLNSLDKAIALLVKQGNDRALYAMQSCISELLRRASECRLQGCNMGSLSISSGAVIND